MNGLLAGTGSWFINMNNGIGHFDLPDDVLDLLAGHHSGAENARDRAGKVNHGRFNPHFAGPAVKNYIYRIPQLRAHVIGSAIR